MKLIKRNIIGENERTLKYKLIKNSDNIIKRMIL